jgi:hypothetical protein
VIQYCYFFYVNLPSNQNFPVLLTEEEGSEPRARDICEPEGGWGLPVSNEKRTDLMKLNKL